jgi:peroxiredoxin
MTIKTGDKIPEVTFKIVTADGVSDSSSAAIFAGKKVVLVGVPGAFTPTCSLNHMPGFVENADAITAKGVDTIACVAVNDHHVMGAWAESLKAKGRVTFIADASAAFVKALGLDADLSGGGLGIRSKRFVALVEDGVVKSLDVEEKPGDVTVSAAAALMGKL